MTTDPTGKAQPTMQAIRESFGRVVYTHKTHEKAREIASNQAEIVKWANIILTALTSGSLLTTIITSQRVVLYVTAGLAALTLGFLIYQLSFSPEAEAERHRAAAKELWYVREKYIHLLADLKANPSRADIAKRRDGLIEELNLIYKLAPNTSSKAYRAAQKALKVNEEMTFSNEEINSFLPDSLRT